jgi:mitochondrial fission protein ELM1
MNAKPFQILCVSDGRAGIERQTLAVAQAINEWVPVTIKTLRLTPRPPQVYLPPQLWPAPMAALTEEQRGQLVAPWPDVWIGNGRRAIPYSLRAKGWSGGKTLVVQLQDPRMDPARFDLVVSPRHDELTGRNVIETLGAPVWFSDDQIASAKAQFPDVTAITARKVLVVLGGPSKRHRFSLTRAHDIIAALTLLLAQSNHVLITTSRRTPEPVEALFRAFAADNHLSFFATEDQDGPNPYLAWLSQADCALVTEDSTNMMTDAAFFGLPLYLMKLEGGDARFDRLHAQFIEAGAARWFQGHLDTWHYAPVRDALEVGRVIAGHLTNAEL